MLRKKITGLLAAIIVATTVLGAPGVTVKATTINNIDGISNASTSVPEVTPEVIIKDGEYTVNNQVEYIPIDESSNIETGNSMARKALGTTTKIDVKDGQVQMTLGFDSTLFVFMKSIKVSLDGEDLNGKLDETSKAITFNVPSIDSKVRVDMNITAMGKDVSFYVTNDVSELPVIDNETEDVTPEVLEDGTYEITNDSFKVGTTNNSGIRDYIDTKSQIKIEDGKITVTLKYTSKELETNTVRTINYITINGEKVELKTNNEKEISFEVESMDVLYTRILINLTYYNELVPEFIAPGGMHTVDMEILHKGELVKVEDDSIDNPIVKPENPEVPENPETPETPEDDKKDDVVQEGAKVYTAKNEVTHDTQTGVEMARKVLSEDMKIEEVDGKYFATIKFTDFGSTYMNNFLVYVNGNQVNSTKSIKDGIVSLKFELARLDDSIEVSGYVSAMGRSVDFGVRILKDTLQKVEDIIEGGTTGGTTEETSQGGQTSETTEDTEKEEEPQITIGKLYSIQNNVTHESETGVAMARKYLNTTSKIEEIEGQYYVTLTFTGSDFMQNHVIYVNGSEVAVTRTTNGDSTNIRFAVSSLTDDIKVKVYVVPMSREVEFGVELLVDTLTFIKEYTVETLPNTGATTSSVAVAGLGLILTSAGAVLTRKRK